MKKLPGQNRADPPEETTTEQSGESNTPLADAPAVEVDQLPHEAVASPAFDPNHELPAEGGCYIRLDDGTLKRED